MTTYSNPRLSATIDNWPSGKHRVTMRFAIESDPKRGERATRLSEIGGTPKKLTYARKARIVDGDDGKTYAAMLTEYGHVSIMRGDFKYQHESIFPRDAGYDAAMKLFA